MQSNQTLSNATPETIHQHLLKVVEHLLKKLTAGENPLEELSEVQHLLESLPLATSEYGLACNRLGNAQRYLLSQELGAARYEFQLLTGSLRNRESLDVGPKLRMQRHGN